MSPHESLLLTDFYQLAMLQAYAERGLTGTAVFEFFVRKPPPSRGFLMAAGLEQALHFLEAAHFTEAECEALRRMGGFPSAFIEGLAGFRFTGDVDAMAEGTVFFPDEPELWVIAPLPQAQLVESRIVNLIHFQTVIASKAARMVLAASENRLSTLACGAPTGPRPGSSPRAPAISRALPGRRRSKHRCASASRPLARWRIPSFRPMTTRVSPSRISPEQARGPRPLDRHLRHRARRGTGGGGGETTGARQHSRPRRAHRQRRPRRARPPRARAILDAHGLQNVTVFASGGLDEERIAELARLGAPIDGYGVGTSLTTSSDAPALDCTYKIQEYDGIPRRKRSEGKATWPGRKQIWRHHAADGGFVDDVLGLMGEARDGDPLLQPVMRSGRRLAVPPSLSAIRADAAEQLRRLPAALRQLQPMTYPVSVSDAMRKLADECDRRMESNAAAGSARD